MPLPRPHPRRLGVFAWWLAAASLLSAAPAAWDPIDPAQLAESAPRIDADAPAEVIFWKLTIDDGDFPLERHVREYVRYKIFDPEKAVDVTRVALTSGSIDGQPLQGDLVLRARLTLPNGTSREFGNESIQERPIVRSGAEQTWTQRLFGGEGLEVNEKFLAVSGIEPGSVLEFQLAHTAHNPVPLGGRYTLQRAIPVRRVELTQLICPNNDAYSFRPFALNRGQAQIQSDPKKHVLTLVAHDLPALAHEPFSGATSDYALTYLYAYRAHNTVFLSHRGGDDNVQVDAKSGPWASYATKIFLFERDLAVPDTRVRKLAAQLTAGAPSELEKARRIHRFVEDLHQQFLQTPHKPVATLDATAYVSSIDQVLDFQRNSDVPILPEDFQWLAIALYRAAGLQAQTVMLPNRASVRFSQRLVADIFLPNLGARVLADGQWQFDDPVSPTRIPFGLLPWQAEGQVALVAQSNRQEFIPVPLTPSAQSVIANSGDFQLDEHGNLVGQCRRAYTGQCAQVIRALFRRANAPREQGILRRQLAAEFKPALIRIQTVSGADGTEAPLVVAYEMRFREFAVLTQDRMIFRPSVFHGSSPAPFASATRHYDLQFPYQWQESDTVTLQLPAGYLLESKTAPPSIPGEVLSYGYDMTYEPGARKIHLQRDFMSKALYAPVAAYPAVKAWYDQVAANDQHELVLRRTTAPAPTPQGADPDAPSPSPDPL